MAAFRPQPGSQRGRLRVPCGDIRRTPRPTAAALAPQCALAMQRAVQSELGDHPDGPIRIRIGMHTGDAMREDDDFYGRNVSLAARIAEHAKAGEVLASAVVKQLAESGGDISFEDERVVELKGLGEQAVYTVVAGRRE